MTKAIRQNVGKLEKASNSTFVIFIETIFHFKRENFVQTYCNTLQVDSNLGADGSGSIVTLQGTLRSINGLFTLTYEAQHVYNASDPSIMQVHFIIYSREVGLKLCELLRLILNFGRIFYTSPQTRAIKTKMFLFLNLSKFSV